MAKSEKSNRQLRRRLLGGASAIAITAMLLAPLDRKAEAAEAEPTIDGTWLSLQAGYNFYSSGDDVQNFPAYGATPYTVRSGANEGSSFRAEFGTHLIGTPWALAFRFEYGRSTDEKTGGFSPNAPYAGAYENIVDHEEEHYLVDFEAQRDVGLGILGVRNTKAKARMGLRFAHFNAQSTNAYGSASYPTQFNETNRTFSGAGPMLGLDTSTPIGANLSFDTSSAFALLFGERSNGGFHTPYGTPNSNRGNEGRSGIEVVPNIDISAGIKLGIPSMNGALSLGYRVNALFGVYDVGHLSGCNAGLTVCSGEQDGDRIMHGPYIRMTLGGEEAGAHSEPAPAPTIDGTWLSLEGSYNLYSASDDIQNFASYGPSYTVRSRARNGFGIRAEAGKHLVGSPWALALRFEYGKSTDEKTGGASLAPNAIIVDHDEEHYIVDFEAQRDLGLGILGVPNTKAKARIGLRFAHFNAQSTNSYNAAYPVNETNRTFSGGGPMLGLDTSTPIGANLSFDTSSAFALLFGERSNGGSLSSRFPNGAAGNEARSGIEIVPNFDVSAGIKLGIPSMNGSLSLGYRVNALFGVYDVGHLANCANGGLVDCSGEQDGDRIIHGPYVRFKVGGN